MTKNTDRATTGDERPASDHYYLYTSFPLYATLIVLYVYRCS